MTTTPPPMPEALRLADCLDGNAMAAWTREDAAALLRAQHQRITVLEAENARLRSNLIGASNYIDNLGGVSKSYRIALEWGRPAIDAARTALENTE